MPLRPSKLGAFLKCPMNVLLSMYESSEGAEGAQTGSVVHAAVETFHRLAGEPLAVRQEAARATVAQSLLRFPEANEEKARRWIEAYITDPKNITADVRWLEQSVTLTIPVEEGPPVVIRGTLDQVRYDAETGTLSVWDLKTGVSLTPEEAVTEYQAQQACYVLAARETLDKSIIPGGLIFAVGYDKPRARRFLPMQLTVSQCEDLMREVAHEVQRIRRGVRSFRPSAGACAYCPHKQYPKCSGKATGLLGATK